MKDGHLVQSLKIMMATFNAELWRWTVSAMTAMWAFVAPSSVLEGAITYLLGAVFLDMWTGVRVAKKRGKYIQSRLWNRIVDKAIAYAAIIALPSLAMRGFPDQPLIPAATVAILGLACYGETVSLLENIGALGFKWAIPIAKALRVRMTGMIEEQEQLISGTQTKRTD